jgi:hypothetical protein
MARPAAGSANSAAHASAAAREPSTPSVQLEVLVASKNRVKVDAVQGAISLAFGALAATVVVHGVEAPSGVPEQPIGDAQTLQG